MGNVFERLALYRSHGANALLISDWIKLFLKDCDIVLEIPGCWKSMALGICVYYNDFIVGIK